MSEHDEQTELFRWLKSMEGQYPNLKYIFAIPNGAALAARSTKGKRFSLQASKLKAEGMRRGVPDVCVPIPRGKYHGLWIEMKFGRNGLTQEQLDFLVALEIMGHKTCTCYGADEAKAVIRGYLGILEDDHGAG